MSKQKPTDPFPDDTPHRADIPPEPADLFETDTDPVPLAEPADAEVLGEADLFDFTEPVTEPMEAVRAAGAPPKADDDDILAWDILESGSSASLSGQRPDADESSILSGRGTATAGSGWFDSAARQLPPDAADPVRGYPLDSETGVSASGVNLHNPNATGPTESESSIFGRAATDQSSRVEIPIPPHADQATDAVEVLGPASIWDEAEPADAAHLAALRDDPAATVDWDAFKGLGKQVRQLRHEDVEDEDFGARPFADPRDPGPAPAGSALDLEALKGLGEQVRQVRQLRHEDAAADAQHTLRAPRPDLDAAPPDDDFDAWLREESSEAVKAAPPRVPTDPTAVGLPLGARTPTPAPTSPPPRRPVPPVEDIGLDIDEDDEPVTPKRAVLKPADEKKKAKSGAGAWIGGGLLGLLLGGGGVFGLHQAGVLGDDTAKPTAPGSGASADAGKVAQLQQALTKAEGELKDATDKLKDGDAAIKAGEEAVKNLDAAKAAEKEAKEQLLAAKKAEQNASAALTEATKKQIDAESKLTAAIKAGDKATLELNVAREDLKAAMKDVAAVKESLAASEKDLDAAKKKAKAGEDAVAGLVKEFKAAKLIPEDADAATALAALPDAAKKAVASASGDTKKLAEELAAAKKDADGLKAAVKTATDDLAKAKADTEKAIKVADDRAQEVADAQKKAKASEDVLAGLVKEFKSAKLIDADADAATALAKLPDAAKKAAANTLSGDAAKAAEALAAAKKDLEVAQTAAKKAEADLVKAKAEAQDATARADKATEVARTEAAKMLVALKTEMTKAVESAKEEGAKAVAAAKKETDDKVKDAVAKATADTDAKLKAADAKVVTVEKAKADAEAKAKAAADALAAKEAEFARQLAIAKAAAGTVALPPAVAEAVGQEKAMASYSAGVSHYFAGRYTDAERELRAAGAGDARFSYYLGLALLAQGKADAAAESFAAGAALERRNRPNARDVGEALERIQGAPRKELAKYRPM